MAPLLLDLAKLGAKLGLVVTKFPASCVRLPLANPRPTDIHACPD